MYAFSVLRARTPISALGFLFSKIGQLTTARFATQVLPLGLRPRHCGLLAVAAQNPSISQEDLSRALGLVPSGVVGIVDDLEGLGAVRRVSDPDNRRRYSIQLTKHGYALLARCSDAAEQVDQEILADLSPKQRATLASLLEIVGGTLGIISQSEPKSRS